MGGFIRKYAETSEFSFHSRNGTWSSQHRNYDEWRVTQDPGPSRVKVAEGPWQWLHFWLPGGVQVQAGLLRNKRENGQRGHMGAWN